MWSTKLDSRSRPEKAGGGMGRAAARVGGRAEPAAVN